MRYGSLRALPPRHLRRVALFLTLGGAVTVWSCSDTSAPPVPGTPAVAAVQVTPSVDTLTSVGETTSLSVAATDASGAAVPGKTATWSSTNSSVATVDNAGLVTAAGPNGTATITARVDNVNGSATITVVASPAGGTVSAAEGRVVLVIPPGALTTPIVFTVDPSTTTVSSERVVAGTTFNLGPDGTEFAQPVQLTLRYDPANVPLGLPQASLDMQTLVDGTWAPVTSSTIDTTANTVTAELDGFSIYGLLGSVPSVTVEPGDTAIFTAQVVQLTATARDAGGDALTGFEVVWASSDNAVASVDDSGAVTGVALGSATISATIGDTEGVAQVRVGGPADLVGFWEGTAPSVFFEVTDSGLIDPFLLRVSMDLGLCGNGATLVARNGPFNIADGQFRDTLTWAGGRDWASTVQGTFALPGRATGTYGSGGGSVDFVSGIFRCTGTARFGQGRWSAAPQLPPVSFQMTPSDTALSIHDRVQVIALPLNASGEEVKFASHRDYSWTISDTTVATLGPAGMFGNVQAVAPGAAVVTVTTPSENGPVSGTATVRVLGLASVVITISPDSVLSVDGALSLHASPLDERGNFVTGHTFTWESSDSNVVTVQSEGGVFGGGELLNPGTAVITGTTIGPDGPVSGTATVRVLDVVSMDIISPSGTTITEGGNKLFFARPLDVNGNLVSGRTITWTSSDTTVATVDSDVSGVTVTARSAGTTTITATTMSLTGPVSGTATVTVTAAGELLLFLPDRPDRSGATLGVTTKDIVGLFRDPVSESASTNNSRRPYKLGADADWRGVDARRARGGTPLLKTGS